MAQRTDQPAEHYLGFLIRQHAEVALDRYWCKTTASEEDGVRVFGFTERVPWPQGRGWPSDSEELTALLARRGMGLARAALALNAVPETTRHFRAVALSSDGPPHSLSADEDAVALLVLAALRNLRLIFRDRGENRVDVRGIGELVGAHPSLSENVLERLAERREVTYEGMGWNDNFGGLTITELGRSRLGNEQPVLPPNEYGFEIPAPPDHEPKTDQEPRTPLVPDRPGAVFLVHGRDEGRKQEVARWLERVGLEPVILHERPNAGRTIIEKFSEEANGVGYAVVLATGDDEGRLRDEARLETRPRQNVILELGFFLGKLGRDRVSVLRAPDVELPSDYHGVLYIELDLRGAWKLQLAQELQAAGLSVDSSKLSGA